MRSITQFLTTYNHILKLAFVADRKMFFTVIFSNLLWGASNLPVMYINMSLIDLVIKSSANFSNTTIYTLIILVLARVLIEFSRNIISQISHDSSGALGSLMSDKIVLILGKKLNSLDVAMVESSEFQDKYNQISNKSHSKIWSMISTLAEIPNSVTTIISGVIPFFQFEPWIVLLVLSLSLFQTITGKRMAKLNYYFDENRRKDYRYLGRLDWIISSVSEFENNKITGNIDYISQKMHELQIKIFSNDVKRRLTRVKWGILSDIPFYLGSLFTNIYFFYKAIVGQISLGTAQLLYSSSQTLSNGIGMFYTNVFTVYENYLYVKDYEWLMSQQSSAQSNTVHAPSHIKDSIKFENVSFKYANSQELVLKDISLEISKNENIAIVGHNGAGKTTLLKLLLGFYKPTEGRITVDGVDVSSFNPQSYMKRISVLFQNFHLFPFSARESIAYSDLSRLNNEEDIINSAKKAEIHEFISSLKDGYNTPLAKDLEGVEPSGGQAQRIAIASAIFKDSPIVVLDEPTSNIDPKAEEDIFKNIISHCKNKILILVSHRFSTVRKADKIVLMEAGTIIEQGTHKELMAQKGKYAKLFTLQAKSYK